MCARGLCLLVLLLGGGCSKFRAVRECGSFIETINAWKAQDPRSAPAAAVPAPSAAVSESRHLAERYQDLAARIDKLKIGSAELRPRALRYQKLAREAARALTDVASAVERGDSTEARRRRVEFDDLSRGEAPLVAEINRVCR